MNREEFDRLVSQLEPFANRSPFAYKARVGLLALLGYGYIFSVLAVLAVIIALLGAAALTGKHLYVIGKIGIPLLLLAAVILRALWVRLDEPEGHELKRGDAPGLFAAIDDMRRQLRGPRIHRVLLTDEYNASVTQTPRLGLFGWQKNHLMIGLPLMQALSPDQFRAVLAHEYGHLAGAHSRFSCWIYRIRKSWHQLMQALEKEGRSTWLFSKFFNWYSPYFAAYSFVLARANEYEADGVSRRLVGAQHAADALINFSLKSELLQRRFWPQLHARADETPAPAFGPCVQMDDVLRQPLDANDSRKWLDAALSRKTDSDDTHPCLTDRLHALSENPRVPEPVVENAARHYFGENLKALAERLDHDWRQRIAESWRERYDHVQNGKAEVARLGEKAAQGELELQEAWDHAYWTEQVEGGSAALPLYRSVLVRAEEEAAPQFAVGRLLLEQDDESGIVHLEKAMAIDPSRTEAASERIGDFLYRRGQEEAARVYYRRAYEAQQLDAAAGAERSSLTTRDKFVSHGLDEETLEVLREDLRKQPRIVKAWLARKVLEHRPDQEPVYGLAIQTVVWHLSGAKFVEKLCKELTGVGTMYIVVVNAFDEDAHRTIGKAIKKTEDTLIYRR